MNPEQVVGIVALVALAAIFFPPVFAGVLVLALVDGCRGCGSIEWAGSVYPESMKPGDTWRRPDGTVLTYDEAQAFRHG